MGTKLGFVRRHPYVFSALIAALSTAIILVVILIVLHYAPFGDKSIAIIDGHIQYFDFFSFFRHVLTGSDSIFYSFNKSLGGMTLTLFAYYLASPFSLLVIFFSHADINTFFSLIFILKLALSAATCAIFLTYRFKSQIVQTPAKIFFIILLSISFGLCQYNLSQSSNTMWLDGVYMLPLIMLGVSKLVREQSSWLLTIFVGLTILFNWYIGAIDCIFACLWFVFEVALRIVDQSSGKSAIAWQNILTVFGRFVLAMALGVLISCLLFMPSVLGILGSDRSTVPLSELLDPSMMGDVPNLIIRYTLGAWSNHGAVSLFCGSLALIGIAMSFISHKTPKSYKIIFATTLILLILTFYWRPLHIVFSLLSIAPSYYYRYAFGAILFLIFFAAYYFCTAISVKDYSKVFKLSALAALTLIVAQFIEQTQNRNYVYATAAVLLALGSIFALLLYGKAKGSRRLIRFSTISLVLIFCLEMCVEVYSIVRIFQEVTVSEVTTYTEETTHLLEGIHQLDSSEYRISQTTSMGEYDTKRNANYNESIAYGYKTVGDYTSVPDSKQLTLLDRLGYSNDYNLATIVNTSVIPTDSLLGVKYVMSSYPINGLVPTDIVSETSEKRVYRNPFALPMALVYQDNDLTVDYDGNSFLYQNQLYSKLLGRPVELYQPLSYRIDQVGDAETSKSQQYTLNIPQGNYAVYGEIRTTGENPGMLLDVDGKYQLSYAWGQNYRAVVFIPSLFYIPTDKDTTQVQLTLTSPGSYYLDTGNEQFYALDLNLLAQITQELYDHTEPVEIAFDHGKAHFSVNAESGKNLYISLTENSGWTITRNGEVITPELIADTLYSIPLVDGENTIEMRYTVPGFRLGLILSIMGVVGVIVVYFVEKKQNV